MIVSVYPRYEVFVEFLGAMTEKPPRQSLISTLPSSTTTGSVPSRSAPSSRVTVIDITVFKIVFKEVPTRHNNLAECGERGDGQHKHRDRKSSDSLLNWKKPNSRSALAHSEVSRTWCNVPDFS